MGKLFKTKDVLAMLRVSDNTILRWRKGGTFPEPIMIGSRHYWREDQIQEWMSKKDVSYQQPPPENAPPATEAKAQPMLLARDLGNGVWAAWCPFCRREHSHSSGPGHRVAHCTNDDSPFCRTGYELAICSEVVLERIRANEREVG